MTVMGSACRHLKSMSLSLLVSVAAVFHRMFRER